MVANGKSFPFAVHFGAKLALPSQMNSFVICSYFKWNHIVGSLVRLRNFFCFLPLFAWLVFYSRLYFLAPGEKLLNSTAIVINFSESCNRWTQSNARRCWIRWNHLSNVQWRGCNYCQRTQITEHGIEANRTHRLEYGNVFAGMEAIWKVFFCAVFVCDDY